MPATPVVTSVIASLLASQSQLDGG